MKPVSYYITVSGCIALIALGVYLSSWASSNYLWKMDAARALLSSIQSTSDPNSIESNIAVLSPDDSTFHSGMLNIHAQASTITFNLIDAESNVWISPAFLLANSLWMVGVAGMWKLATRYRQEQLK